MGADPITNLQTLTVLLLYLLDRGGVNVVEYFFGPRLGNPARYHPELGPKYQTTEQLVNSYGFPLETHSVESSGYILTLHRIPRGRKAPPSRANSKNPILIIHGLMGCSDMWLTRGPKLGLPYILADSGYDVWLYNIRGNFHSRKHKWLNPDKDPTFWDFGPDEIGYYDLPRTIDYILDVTNQRDLYLMGHSLGGAIGFVTCALRPEYNEKIRLFLALGPSAHITHQLSPFQQFLLASVPALARLVQSMGICEIFPRRPYFSDILHSSFEDGSPFQRLFLTFVFDLIGEDESELDTKDLLHFIQYYPAGTSLRVVYDTVTWYLAGKFVRHDYGDPQVNMLHYNSTSPPVYDLSKVTAPVSIHYGLNDPLVTPLDVDALAGLLPNLVGTFQVPYERFTHLDFVLAANARQYLYDWMVRLMDRYKRGTEPLDFPLQLH